MKSIPTYAAELQKVMEVATCTAFLTTAGSVPGRLVNAQAFTIAVARELRDLGWGCLFKTTGLNIDSMAIDLIVNRFTGDVAKVIRDAGTFDAAVCFEVRPAGARSLWIDPDDPATKAAVLSRAEVNFFELSTTLTRIDDRLGDIQRVIRDRMLELGSVGARVDSSGGANG